MLHFARFWWRSRTRIFRKTFISNVPWIWNSTTIHIRSIFQKKFCWLGLAVRISSEWLGKKIPAIKNDDFLTFYWQALAHFDCYTAMNWPWLSKIPWIFQNPESRRRYNFFPGPVDSNFEIKMLFFEFWVKKIAERGHYKLWKWSQIMSKLMSNGQKPQFFHVWSLYGQMTFKTA